MKKLLIILTALFLSFSASSAYMAEFDRFTWQIVTAADIKKAIAAGRNVNARYDDDWMPLHYASLNSSINVVNALIAAGANVNAKINAPNYGYDGQTPLHKAVFNKTPDYLDIIKALIAAGADVNVKEKDMDQTPLRYFVWNYIDNDFQGHFDPVKIVKTLIAAGADPKIKDRTGRPLVTRNYFPEMNKVLINSGALYSPNYLKFPHPQKTGH